MRLDFSEYHPLDHTLWTCRGYPGGRRRHLAYRWDFQWRDRARQYTWCLLGRHDHEVWWFRDGRAIVVCPSCGHLADPDTAAEMIAHSRRPPPLV